VLGHELGDNLLEVHQVYNLVDAVLKGHDHGGNDVDDHDSPLVELGGHEEVYHEELVVSPLVAAVIGQELGDNLLEVHQVQVNNLER
jgi:hypothetical protein